MLHRSKFYRKFAASFNVTHINSTTIIRTDSLLIVISQWKLALNGNRVRATCNCCIFNLISQNSCCDSCFAFLTIYTACCTRNSTNNLYFNTIDSNFWLPVINHHSNWHRLQLIKRVWRNRNLNRCWAIITESCAQFSFFLLANILFDFGINLSNFKNLVFFVDKGCLGHGTNRAFKPNKWNIQSVLNF